MIYFDNSATTLYKPPEVVQAVTQAIESFGNSSRSFHEPAMRAARAIFKTRVEIARLVNLDDPMGVAFTSGATESLNLVLNSMITHDDVVVTSVLEHNSVLRPLYRIGCPLSFVDCDDYGCLSPEDLDACIQKDTRFVVCTHGSNLTGTVIDAKKLHAFCIERGLILIMDVSQTLGCVEVSADMADVLCFTGHKALFGPQGTGGIIVGGELELRTVKTGGSGSNSFDRKQPSQMPDIFEAGTQNAHGLAGLREGAAFVNGLSIEGIHKKSRELTDRFLRGIQTIPAIRVYGPLIADNRLPVVSLTIEGMASEDVALRLWEDWRIAVRAGTHCAPLAHKRFNTEKSGMVRFSFSYFNTVKEIDTAVSALREIARIG